MYKYLGTFNTSLHPTGAPASKGGKLTGICPRDNTREPHSPVQFEKNTIASTNLVIFCIYTKNKVGPMIPPCGTT